MSEEWSLTFFGEKRQYNQQIIAKLLLDYRLLLTDCVFYSFRD